MLPSPRIFSCRKSAAHWLIVDRLFSLNEVSVALRPFYFAVHPDRFAQHPMARERNEKSLQVFNGYLNDLFPLSPTIKPTEISFFIKEDKKQKESLKLVSIQLRGTDAFNIARKALEQCNLSTNKLPTAGFMDQPTTSRSRSAEEESFEAGFSTSNIDQDLLRMYLRRKKTGAMGKDLNAVLVKNRDVALKKTREARKTRQTLKEEIDDIKWRTGVTDIVWQMDWAESHMRRCLSLVNRLLDHDGQSEKERKEVVIRSLYKNVLRFGRGSFVCCDGSIQFGADNVPEQWQQVCAEAVVRRRLIPQLSEIVSNLREMLGGAIVIVANHRCLAQTIQQFETILVRIKTRSDFHDDLKTHGEETMIEVVTTYDELAVGPDGRIFVPCNVSVSALVQFLKESAQKSKTLNRNMLNLLKVIQATLKAEAATTVENLGLISLDWEGDLRIEDVLITVQRLNEAANETKDLLRGLAIRLSINPNVHVMNDGRVSVPLNWI